MQRLFDTYNDVAEFRIVYINEAHAADSEWSVPYAEEKSLKEHTSYKDRCSSAELLLMDNSLTIPCIIDGMDNQANLAFAAWPDRIFVVRTDGVLAVAGNQGPWGFVPALEETEAWLASFKSSGKEPDIKVKDSEE